MTEQWRPVAEPRLCDHYSISDQGRVRRDTATLAWRPGKILKPFVRPIGYHAVNLSVDAERRIFLIHRLVAASFIGPCPDGHQCNHKDGNKGNNSPANLEWVTPKQNIRHSIDVLGNRPANQPKGEDHYRARLTAAQVVEIRSQVAAGRSQYSLAKHFGVDKRTVNSLIHGKSWRSVQ